MPVCYLPYPKRARHTIAIGHLFVQPFHSPFRQRRRACEHTTVTLQVEERETYAVLGVVTFVVHNDTSATDAVLCLYLYRYYLVLPLQQELYFCLSLRRPIVRHRAIGWQQTLQHRILCHGAFEFGVVGCRVNDYASRQVGQAPQQATVTGIYLEYVCFFVSAQWHSRFRDGAHTIYHACIFQPEQSILVVTAPCALFYNLIDELPVLLGKLGGK